MPRNADNLRRQMRTGVPDRRSRRRLAWAGVATGLALFSAACGRRVGPDAVVAPTRGGAAAGAPASQPGAAGTTTSGGATPGAGSVLPGDGSSAGPGAVGT